MNNGLQAENHDDAEIVYNFLKGITSTTLL